MIPSGTCSAPLKRISQIRPLVICLLEALEFVHASGITHCDVKPDNLLCDPDDPDHPLLTDFGSAIADGPAPKTVQTMQYRSPEAILGLPIGPAIDLWSAGCLIVELFLTFPLFEFNSEFDVFLAIVGTIGQPPPELLLAAPRTGEFFDGAEPREDPVRVIRERHLSSSELAGRITLDELIPGEETRPFRELVRGLLQWDSGLRLTAKQALAQEYCQND
jgi:serine/threonine protein kinase